MILKRLLREFIILSLMDINVFCFVVVALVVVLGNFVT